VEIMGAILKLKSLLGGSLNLKIDETATDDEFNITTGGIESGSNANGEYTKFPDGTLICTGKYSKTTVFSASGNIFTHADGVKQTFPIPFVGQLPKMSVEVYGSTAMWASARLTSLTDFEVVSMQGSSTNSTLEHSWMAIGRWK
jgi:hypothetical protein